MFESTTAPIRAMVRAASRPETYLAQVREASSTAVTAAFWPFGWIDRGLVELRSRAAADHSPVATPVLLIHGFGANKSNWYFIGRELRNAGFERIHALNYSPLAADVPALAARCRERAEQLMDHFETDRIHVIGHSLGGLVARYAVQLGGLEGVDTCITIGTPHEGTPLARNGFGTTAHQLAPGSPMLQRLRGSARRLPTKFVAYYSNVDVLVPGWFAMLHDPALRATNVLVKDEGHVSMMWSRRVAVSIAAQLGAAEGLPGYGAPVAGLPQETVCSGGEKSTAHPNRIHGVVPLPVHRPESVGCEEANGG